MMNGKSAREIFLQKLIDQNDQLISFLEQEELPSDHFLENRNRLIQALTSILGKNVKTPQMTNLVDQALAQNEIILQKMQKVLEKLRSQIHNNYKSLNTIKGYNLTDTK